MCYPCEKVKNNTVLPPPRFWRSQAAPLSDRPIGKYRYVISVARFVRFGSSCPRDSEPYTPSVIIYLYIDKICEKFYPCARDISAQRKIFTIMRKTFSKIFRNLWKNKGKIMKLHEKNQNFRLRHVKHYKK